MRHLTGREGGSKGTRAFTRPNDSPLVDPENADVSDFDPLQPSTEHLVYLLGKGFRAHTRPAVKKDAVSSVREALRWLSNRVGVTFVHVDVDVIDCGEFPPANYPYYAGVEADKVFTVLEEALACEKVRELTLGDYSEQ